MSCINALRLHERNFGNRFLLERKRSCTVIGSTSFEDSTGRGEKNQNLEEFTEGVSSGEKTYLKDETPSLSSRKMILQFSPSRPYASIGFEIAPSGIKANNTC